MADITEKELDDLRERSHKSVASSKNDGMKQAYSRFTHEIALMQRAMVLEADAEKRAQKQAKDEVKEKKRIKKLRKDQQAAGMAVRQGKADRRAARKKALKEAIGNK